MTQRTRNATYIYFEDDYEGRINRCQVNIEDNRNVWLQDMDRVVIDDEKIKIWFKYPLTYPTYFEAQNKGGFTRGNLLKFVRDGYRQIYLREEETTPTRIWSYQRKCQRCYTDKNKLLGEIVCEGSNDICPICREDLSNGVWKLPCSHLYHSMCILTWLNNDANEECPMCRQVCFKKKCDFINCDGITSVFYEGKIPPIDMRSILFNGFTNRPRTHGEFGIYHYDLENLWIHKIIYNPHTREANLYITC